MQEMSMIRKKYLIKKFYLIITQTKKKVKGGKINHINILNFEKVEIFAKKDENKQEN